MALRVLHVIASPDCRRGGPQFGLIGLAPAQQGAGVQVEIAASYQPGERFDIQSQLASANIPVTLIGPTHGPLRRAPKMRSTLDGLIAQADIVHIHGLWEEVVHQAARGARAAGRPYVITPHGMLDPWSLAQKWLKKRLYLAWRLERDLRQAAAIHCITDVERRLAAPWIPASHAIVEPAGIQLRDFDPATSGEPFRRQFPEIGNRRIVLFLSRVHPKKGLDLLIPAMSDFRGEDIVLAIVGPGDDAYLRELHVLIRNHRLENQVVITGMVDNSIRVSALSAAELLVLPSYQENFGLVVVEALAMERPVVVSDQVQIQEEIEPAGVGSVVSLNVSRLTTEIRRWLDDEPARREAGRRGRVLVEQRFTWPPIGARWFGHYQRLLDENENRNDSRQHL